MCVWTAAEVDQSVCSSSCLDSVSMQSTVCVCVCECVCFMCVCVCLNIKWLFVKHSEKSLFSSLFSQTHKQSTEHLIKYFSTVLSPRFCLQGSVSKVLLTRFLYLTRVSLCVSAGQQLIQSDAAHTSLKFTVYYNQTVLNYLV